MKGLLSLPSGSLIRVLAHLTLYGLYEKEPFYYLVIIPTANFY